MNTMVTLLLNGFDVLINDAVSGKNQVEDVVNGEGGLIPSIPNG